MVIGSFIPSRLIFHTKEYSTTLVHHCHGNDITKRRSFKMISNISHDIFNFFRHAVVFCRFATLVATHDEIVIAKITILIRQMSDATIRREAQ